EGKSNLIGKPVGGDIKEKKITLPLLYALNQVSKNEASRIRKILKNGNDNLKVKEVMKFVNENNGIDYAIKIAQNFSDQAKESLNIFPDSQIKNSMLALVDFVTDRKT
ncbi:MAG TPA: polyprenyl synthetase family protein, partial [Ignavibacteriaceae bacterium]|nr:polyprenyl synthetase family protein [Ignavibacteriaceae bacterium]